MNRLAQYSRSSFRTLRVYGAQSISGSCLTRLMLRSVEHATAEWAAQSLGEEVNEATNPSP